MPTTSTMRGKCLCGQVTLTAKEVEPTLAVCHCGMCRQWGSGPMFVVDAGNRVSIEGEESITRFDSSDWAERGFCKACGTQLFYRLKGNGEYFLFTGIFEPQKDWVFNHEIFIEGKPAFFNFANDTKKMTGEEVFAQFAPPS